jgi:hypothetical protein
MILMSHNMEVTMEMNMIAAGIWSNISFYYYLTIVNQYV